MLLTINTILWIAILFIPMLILTILIWVFGGWTKGWDYMPNPLYKLMDITLSL